MKHVITPGQGRSEARVKTPNRRALAKMRTRAKVLESARQLFSTQGYEGATIRDIAAAAGMSTGAVFASFADKSALFREIMKVDLEALAQTMREAGDEGRNVEDSLLRIFSAGYAFCTLQLPLARAALSAWWFDGEARPQSDVAPLHKVIAEQLHRGVQRNELDPASEVELRTDMLYQCYMANYRQAVHGDWGFDALQARSRDQIRVILAGVRRG